LFFFTLYRQSPIAKPFSIVKSKTLANALVQTYKFIQGALGLDVRVQITVICDTSPFDGKCNIINTVMVFVRVFNNVCVAL